MFQVRQAVAAAVEDLALMEDGNRTARGVGFVIGGEQGVEFFEAEVHAGISLGDGV